MLMLRQYASVMNAAKHFSKPITPNIHTHTLSHTDTVTVVSEHLL